MEHLTQWVSGELYVGDQTTHEDNLRRLVSPLVVETVLSYLQ